MFTGIIEGEAEFVAGRHLDVGSATDADDELVGMAVGEVAAGRPVVVTGDENQDSGGELMFAADSATPELLAFLIKYSAGMVCAPMPGEELHRLHIGQLTSDHNPKRTAVTLTVDAAHDISTGSSAADRSRTVRVLADPAAVPSDLTRPGHVFPLRVHPGGVLERRGYAEAAVDLAVLAGRRPVGVMARLINDDGAMMHGRQPAEFAADHGLVMIDIDQLARYRWRHESLLERLAVTTLPTAYGIFTGYAYRSRMTGVEHLALVHGDLIDDDAPVLTRVHSECLTGDGFGSLRCDCGPQLHDAMTKIADQGRGVLVYLRGQEGRGIGLAAKLQAYQLQDSGRDTLDANLDLGLPVDARSYDDAGQILRDLGVTQVRLITNNPAKGQGLERSGVMVAERLRTGAFATPYNLTYLRTKRDRMGHELLDEPTGTAE